MTYGHVCQNGSNFPGLLPLPLVPKFVVDVNTLVLSNIHRGRSHTAINPANLAASRCQCPGNSLPQLLLKNLLCAQLRYAAIWAEQSSQACHRYSSPFNVLEVVRTPHFGIRNGAPHI